MTEWTPPHVIHPFPNPWPFNGDFPFKEKLRGLVKEHDLKWVIETGTSCGNSTKALSELFDKVYTIEVNKDQYDVTLPMLKSLGNVTAYHGHSGKILGSIIKNLDLKGNGAFYLDAHWYDSWPLLDELNAIAESDVKGRCMIMIDDFDIPGVVEGDKYKDQVLNLAYVKEDLMKTGATNYEFHEPELPQFRGKLISKPW